MSRPVSHPRAGRRGICPECGRDISVTLDGYWRAHHSNRSEFCALSRQPARGVVGVFVARTPEDWETVRENCDAVVVPSREGRVTAWMQEALAWLDVARDEATRPAQRKLAVERARDLIARADAYERAR